MNDSALPAGERAGSRPPLDAEWLDVDATSGFACGTVGGSPARRYHGWLVACPDGTARRHHFLARCVEIVEVGGDAGARVELDGTRLTGFVMRPWPTWTFDCGGGVALRRELVMVAGARAVLWRYSALGGEVSVRVEPHLTCRDADHLHFANDVHRGDLRPSGQGAWVFEPYQGVPAVHVTAQTDGRVEFGAAARWERGIELSSDLRRGYDGHEDHFVPGAWTVRVGPGETAAFGASIVAPERDPMAAFERATASRRQPAPTSFRERMARSAEDFLYRTPEGRLGVLAGFPWFGEWGRDTFLSLPGLTLARSEVALCADGLRGALPFLRDGLLPNIFGVDQEDSHYGSVDASMWFARAVQLYDRAGGDQALVLDGLASALEQIAEAYREGTGLGVGADDELLLHSGSEDLNSTWMDAQVDGVPVTPRQGCAVEMNALWYQLLAYLEELAARRRDATAKKRWANLRTRAGTAFVRRFWLEDHEGGCLADRVHDGRADRAIRPNMVMAAAQELSPLSVDQRRKVVAISARDLVTPLGMRTLSPSDPAYRGRYEGGTAGRDRAYHQGTVWPWTLGSHVEAAWRVGPRNSGVAARLEALWTGMAGELDRAGLEHLSEVFDGDEPRRPGGTFAQAWNTAECLRSLALLEARR